jgi:hypothetical protein
MWAQCPTRMTQYRSARPSGRLRGPWRRRSGGRSAS